MKKNISINISGIIFHIEEDGYEALKKYLDSINRYFSTFEDSAEILADIESRIAEIFLSKLNEGKQVITAEDVNALIATMGSVNDFKAAEEENGKTSQEEKTSQQQQSSSYTYNGPKQLVRDQKRKILGGVCAGLANYANVDAVWIRLLFALFTVAYGVTLIIYAVLWIIMPGSYDLEEPKTKKMFRDPENKVLAGVSAGLGTYFGVDSIVFRLLFIILTFVGGIGLLIYIVLWIVLPEAHTITDRMQMQGEPVTLSNIESNIKKNLNVKEGEEESPLVKILLFPFRLLAFLISGLAKIIGPLVDVLRVAIGIVIALIGFSSILAIIIAIGVIMGAYTLPWSWTDHADIGFPLATIQNMIPAWMLVAGFFASVIPWVLVILLGFSIINKRGVISAPVGWSLFTLFFVSVILLAFGIPQMIYSFKEEGEYKTERTFELNGKTAVLKLNEVGMDDYDAVDLTLRGYDGKVFKLDESFEARGSTKQNAIENAQMVEYFIEQQDSILIFDSNIQFKSDAIFRTQRLDMVLYIPYDYPFVMEEEVSRFITQYINHKNLDGYTWKMTQQGLECINCPVEEQPSPFVDSAVLKDFSELDISGKFNVTIRHGNEYAVELSGSQRQKDRYRIHQSGETLFIDFDGTDYYDFNLSDEAETVEVNITLPKLERLEAVGYGSIEFDKLDAVSELILDIKGPIKVKGEISSDAIDIDLNGKAEADLWGKASTLKAEIQFASKLKAFNLEVTDAVVNVTGGSSAKVNVTGTLEMDEGIVSDIDFIGNPKIVDHNQ